MDQFDDESKKNLINPIIRSLFRNWGKKSLYRSGSSKKQLQLQQQQQQKIMPQDLTRDRYYYNKMALNQKSKYEL